MFIDDFKGQEFSPEKVGEKGLKKFKVVSQVYKPAMGADEKKQLKQFKASILKSVEMRSKMNNDES